MRDGADFDFALTGALRQRNEIEVEGTFQELLG